MVDKGQAVKGLSDIQVRQIAQIKRFYEWLQADSGLRNRLGENKELTSTQKEWLKKIGIDLDINEISFLWKHPAEVNTYIIIVTKGLEEHLQNGLKEIISRYPLLELWGEFIKLRSNTTAVLIDQWTSAESGNKKFNAWRSRRIASAKSELGFFGTHTGHPVFSFELNEGCSIGCWFCSFASSKLSATLDYPQRRGEVINIIRQCNEIFDRSMVMMALPYYRTEPHDNPHYIDFLKDFEKETGGVICTSTAVSGDIEWVNDLINYYQKREDGNFFAWPRLSILSLPALRKIHAAFTPMELFSVELLIQVRDHERPKVSGGRILKEQAGLRELDDFDSLERDPVSLTTLVPQGTIACVSGFNINLTNRTIMALSPCYTSEKWPYGFRVFGEAAYNDESDFSEIIIDLVERCMFLTPPRDNVLKFRDDIVFHPTDEGFDLATPNQRHHFKGKSKCGPLGQLIAEGRYTYAQVTEILLTRYMINPIILRAVVQQLFDEGFIDEIYEN